MPTHIDDDQLSIPHFEDRLWDELSQLQQASDASGRARRRRRLLLPAVAAAAAVATLAGTLALVTRDDGSPSVEISPAETSAPTTTVGPTTTDTVVGVGGEDLWEDANGNPTRPGPPDVPPIEAPSVPPDAIVYVEHQTADGLGQRWSDETTGVSRNLMTDASGNPVLDGATWGTFDGPDGALILHNQRVDYQERTYEEWDFDPPMADDDWYRTDWREDFVIRKGLAEGHYIQTGTEIVDGRELLVLVDAMNGQADPESGTTWVEPDTYRPVKRVGYPGEDVGYTQITHYLPRTPENLALLEVPVPEGFTWK